MKEIEQTADGVREHVKVSDPQPNGTTEIDEGLYSRQLYVMGREAQKRMSGANVLLVGLNGLGVEIAKNVILAGVKSLTIADDTPTAIADLSSQFYLTEQDVGKPRAASCAMKLAELNEYVALNVHTGNITSDIIQKFSCVVVVDMPLDQAVTVNEICHQNSIAFIMADVRGVFANVFCDFGDEFLISDKDGERPAHCMVASITNTTPALVTVTDDTRHHMETGDYVTFREVEGIDELNACEPREITVTGPYTFTVGDISPNSSYIKGGYVTQVKQPTKMKFQTLSKGLNAPGEFLISDFAKMGHSEVLHQGFRALSEYKKKNKTFPSNQEQAKEFLAMCYEMNTMAKKNGEFSVENLEQQETLLLQLALSSPHVISPMCAFLGGVVAQETLKACSGKFTPIHQFFYFDAVECLPKDPLSAEESAPSGSRYDPQIALFGRTFHEKLQNLNMFLVGAGAIGCEMLKNWALMGIASGPKGKIHVTDMDIIEKSNLNRQFLFRSSDVQSAKSTTAGKAVMNMNPEVQVQSYVARVGAETEKTFDDAYFESLDGVCTALDNVEARLYMDHRCLFYHLPMFESGTLGTKGNTQVVVPHETENYGASRDPPEKSIPICTLKNFPNAIEHTLQWARDWFEGIFFQTPADVNKYISSSDFLMTLKAQQNTKLETMERLLDNLVTNKPLTFDECILWARLKFEDMFCSQIKQLLFNFPLDQVTSTGNPFWSGPKRPPTPIEFDLNDPLHLNFIISSANSRAENYGLVGRYDVDYFKQVLPKIKVPSFVPKSGVKIAANDSEMKENDQMQDVDEVCQGIEEKLPSPSSLAGYRMNPVEFDKDNDKHMEVIVATSNLRARNYKIDEADMHQSRFIAGKIIPAIATTTALVTGLVCLELYKVFQNRKLEDLKNGFVNLALPLFAFSEPIPPAVTKSMLAEKEYNWTPWDRIDMNMGDITLKEFLDYFTKEYSLDVSMLSFGVSILYAMFSKKSSSPERMAMKMTTLVETVTKKPINQQQKFLIFEVCASDMEGEDVELPYIRYRFQA